MIGPEALPLAYFDRVEGISRRFHSVVTRRMAFEPTRRSRKNLLKGACAAFITAIIEMRRENIEAIERTIGEAMK